MKRVLQHQMRGALKQDGACPRRLTRIPHW